MPDVYNNIIKNSRFVHDKFSLKSIYETFVIDWSASQQSGKPTGGYALQSDAIDTLGLYSGKAHPNNNNYRLMDMVVDVIGASQVKIEARYDRMALDYDIVEMTSSLNGRTVVADKDDEPMVITRPIGLSDTDGPESYLHEAQKQCPYSIARFIRYGVLKSYENAAEEPKDHIGKVNSSGFLDGDAGTWLCTNYEFDLIVDPADSYPFWIRKVTCQYNPDGWQEKAYYRLSNGYISETQDIGSEKTFDVYGESDFDSFINYAQI